MDPSKLELLWLVARFLSSPYLVFLGQSFICQSYLYQSSLDQFYPDRSFICRFFLCLFSICLLFIGRPSPCQSAIGQPFPCRPFPCRYDPYPICPFRSFPCRLFLGLFCRDRCVPYRFCPARLCPFKVGHSSPCLPWASTTCPLSAIAQWRFSSCPCLPFRPIWRLWCPWCLWSPSACTPLAVGTPYPCWVFSSSCMAAAPPRTLVAAFCNPLPTSVFRLASAPGTFRGTTYPVGTLPTACRLVAPIWNTGGSGLPRN